MPITTIPLALAFNQRGANAAASLFTSLKDAMIINAFVTVIENHTTRTAEAYVEKRTGMVARDTPSAGNAGDFLFISPSTGARVGVFLVGGTTYTIFNGTTNCGAVGTNAVVSIIEVTQAGNTYYLISAPGSAGTDAGWYLASDAHSVTAYTGDTDGTAVVTDVKPSTAGMYAGQLVAGSDITVGTRIQSVDSSSQITLTAVATGTTNDLAITKTPVAKILDTDFTALAVRGGFAEINGWVFFMTSNGRVYNFDLNNFTSLSASNYLTADSVSDGGIGVVRYNEYILAFGNESGEIFRVVGNQSGSPLQRVGTFYVGMGVQSSNQKIAQIENQLFWLGSVGSGFGVGLMTLDGLTPRKVSADVVDRLPDNLARLGTVTHSGRSFVCAQNLLLNLKNNTWTRFLYKTNSAVVPAFANNAPLAVFSDASGKVYDWSYGDQAAATYADDSAAYTMRVQTGRFALNQGKSFTIKAVRGINWDNQSSGNSTISTFTDDFTTEQLYGAVSLTDTKKEIKKQRFVKSGAVAFSITDSGNNAWRGEAIEVEWEPSVT